RRLLAEVGAARHVDHVHATRVRTSPSPSPAATATAAEVAALAGLTGVRGRSKISPSLGYRLSLILVLLMVAAPAAHGANYLRLGFDDDTIKWRVKPDGFIGLQRQLDAPFTRITIPWRRGEVKPRRVVRTYLGRARAAGEL